MLISAFGLHPCGADLRSVCAAARRSHPRKASRSACGEMADGEGLPALRSGCLAALGSNCVLHPWKASSPPAADGGWGGIACAALRLSRCARLELRSHPSEKFQAPAARWRMGRDSNPRCIAAHTLSKRAHSTTLPPILEQGELNTMVGRAARRQQAFARLAVQALMAVMEGGQRCFRVRFTV